MTPANVQGQNAAHTGWYGVAVAALDYLLCAWRNDFRDAAHVLSFPRSQGFAVDRDEQSADLFPRAVIADALIEAAEHGAPLEAELRREIAHLLACRRSTGIGGWAYYPALTELPPDADDLAAVMQVLLRCGLSGVVRELCELPLVTLLRDGAHDDGGFEAWIVPRDNRTPEQARQADWIELAWGAGADAEVVANLLYALVLYDRVRFADVLARGAGYLEEQQQADGSWLSTWYHGPYYGTYVAVRALTAIGGASRTRIERASDFLSAARRTDAGWGLPGADSDPLSTSLALLGLTRTRCALGEASATLRLLQEQCVDFPPVPFIRMQLGRHTGRVRQTLSYGSGPVTAAYVLKAALARCAADSGVAPKLSSPG